MGSQSQKLTFNCDSEEVRRELTLIESKLLVHGARFQQDIEVIEKNGEFCVNSGPLAEVNQLLIQIPGPCLPRISDFDLRIENNTMVIHGHSKQLHKTQVECFESMIKIYNLCDKLNRYKQVNPWLALKDASKLLDLLVQGKRGAKKIKALHGLYQEGDVERFLLDGFLGTRAYNLPGGQNREKETVLMPFLDFFNHHFRSFGFKIEPNPEHGRLVGIKASQLVEGSSECFVKYGQLDPMDSFLSYGFIDETSKIFRSVSMEIKLSFGFKLIIDSMMTMYKGKMQLPSQLKNLEFYMPNLIDFDSESMRVSHLLIPSNEAPRALRRVLNVLFRRAKPDMEKNKIIDAVREAESMIVSRNLDYYSQLSQLCKNYQSEKSDNHCLGLLEKLTRRQIEWLKAYQCMT